MNNYRLNENKTSHEHINKKKKAIYIRRRIVFVLCVILLIFCSILLGKKLAQKKYGKSNNSQQYEQSNENNGQAEQNPTVDSNAKKTKIPKITEEGKNNVKNLYSADYKRVFLTFDDGPSSNVTPLILDVLKKNDIKATFFTLGSNVEKNPQIVKRAYEEGHYIANHGYSHTYSSIYASWDNLINEYTRTEEAIRNAIEVPEYSSHLFRFPGGSVGGKYDSVKKQYKKMLGEKEIFYVDWNCLNEDATGNRTKEQLVQYIKNTAGSKKNLVVLMHDASDKILTYETLQEVIDYFKSNEYVFENFYDLIEYEEISQHTNVSDNDLQ